MLHAGLDLSRKRLDVCLITEDGEIAGRVAAPPDADGLRGLVRRIAPCGEPVRAVIESMTGARFVHDQDQAARAALGVLGDLADLGDVPELVGPAELAPSRSRFATVIGSAGALPARAVRLSLAVAAALALIKNAIKRTHDELQARDTAGGQR